MVDEDVPLSSTSMASSPSTLLRSVIGDEGALGPAARI
jgi:hypothetical protein